MEELGHHTVDFSGLICRAVEESFLSLKDLVQKSKFSEQSDSEKKINLIKYIVRTQQRMLRLNVLSKWCQQVPLIQYCQQLGSTLSSHDTCFTQTADSLFFMHEGLQQARAPIYDVPSAVEVLLTGSYERLPKCIEDMGVYSTLTEHQQRSAIKKLDVLVRSKLLGVVLPKEISEVKISDGTALIHVNGEFKALVTLGYRGHLSMWRILHIELLVGEKSGIIKLEESRRHALGDDLERRMAGTENPFVTLYSVMHELCVALVMDTALRQVQALRQGRWKDAVRFELISDGSVGQGSSASSLQKSQDAETDWAGLRTPGLKILYWLDLDKSSATSHSTGCPFLKVEPGQDLQIRCHHSSFVVDPLTGKEAEFSLNQSCIDMENLLLRAICCNRYTRLLEIKKDLAKNSQISRSVGGAVLHSQKLPSEDYRKKDLHNFARELEREDELRVHAYGSTFFALGMDIRTGHFRLHSSSHIIPPYQLVEFEESLNQGSLKPVEIFIRLRKKSVLRLFLSVGRFLGLQAYEHNIAAIKLPKCLLSSSDFLLMGFPDCGCSYLLLIQLDKDFRPLFFLLELGADSSIKTHAFIDAHHVTRIKNINVLRQNSGDIFTSSSNRKALWSSFGVLSQSSANQFQSDFAKEMPSNISECESKFSSIVDEVFELKRGLSGPQTVKNASPFVSASSTANLSSMQVNMAMKNGSPSPKWDGGAQTLPVNDTFRSPATGAGYTSLLHSSANLKGMMQSSSLSALTTGSVKNTPIRKLSASKSDQDIISIKSPHSCEVNSSISLDDAQTKLAKDSLNEAISEKWSSRRIDLKATVQSTAHLARSPSTFLAASTPKVTSPVFEVPDSTVCPSVSLEATCRLPPSSRKRTLPDILNMIPSLHNQHVSNKKKRTMEPDVLPKCSQSLKSSSIAPKTGEYSCSRLVAEGIEEDASSNSHVSTFLHVLRRCTLSIKYARLTSQMEVLGIPYSEEQSYGISSSNLWFRLSLELSDPWPQLCVRLGKPGSMCWDVKINDHYFRDLWELHNGSNAAMPWGSYVRAASSFDVDHIRYDPEGVTLLYQSVEDDSITNMVADLRRLSSARSFALRMQKLLGPGVDEKLEESKMMEKLSDQARKAFKIEAVGLTSLWFSYGSSVLARFVVEWESGKECCTMHISPDQLWPHTKFLEDFVNGMEVASLLDCIRLTAGPLHSLAAATRPARIGPAANGGVAPLSKQGSPMPTHGLLSGNSATNAVINSAFHSAAMLSAAGRGNAGPLPGSLLPIDVSVVLRGPFWIRVIYRKQFSFDMRCFAGDQVWLQAATPPKGGPSVGGSLPCPQFRPFILDHVAQEYNTSDPNTGNGSIRPRSGNQAITGSAGRLSSSTVAGPSNTASVPTRRSATTGVPLHMRGEMNTAFMGLGDDGGYGGGWVPHYALKKVLRGALKYLGVLWLFAQLPDILKEILGSVLKDNEGALLNLDQEQPALRFFIGGYVFAVSVHRLQLLLQVLSVKRFHHSAHPQFAQSEPQEELTQPEISEMCDYFSRRVASEPYNTSRVASFITLLTLPISVLREFLKLIAWKKTSQLPSTDPSPAPKPHIELSLENHAGATAGPTPPGSKSSINYDRANSSVDFGLTVVLDLTHMHHINAAGGAAWLPFCVLVRLRYSFGESPSVSFLGMEGSHGGRACWQRHDEWENCKRGVEQSVEVTAGGDSGQGRLKLAADNVQKTLQFCLNGLAE